MSSTPNIHEWSHEDYQSHGFTDDGKTHLFGFDGKRMGDSQYEQTITLSIEGVTITSNKRLRAFTFEKLVETFIPWEVFDEGQISARRDL